VDVGSNSPTACNSASNQGWSGCWAEQMRKAREERKQQGRDGQSSAGGIVKVLTGDK
jgi:hypothetical protein